MNLGFDYPNTWDCGAAFLIILLMHGWGGAAEATTTKEYEAITQLKRRVIGPELEDWCEDSLLPL